MANRKTNEPIKPMAVTIDGRTMRLTPDWLAGFIDGEAHFGINHHAGNYQPMATIKLRDDDTATLKAIHHWLGGNIRKHKQRPHHKHYTPLHRDQFHWQIVGKHCTRLVAVLRQAHLNTKKAAEFEVWSEAVDIYATSPLTRWSDPELRLKRRMRLAELKRRLHGLRRYHRQDSLWEDTGTRYSVIVADPPWQMEDSLPGPGRGASKHYDTMSASEIAEMSLPPTTEDAVLFFWRLSSMPEEALAIVRAWGFRICGEMIWVKTRDCSRCKGSRFNCARCGGNGWLLHNGMGHTFRAAHEACIIAKRGKPQRLRADVPSVLISHPPLVPGTKRVMHSAKPDKFFDVVESLFAGPYIEMFARKRRQGWDAHGLELPEVEDAAE